jgi:hypothetical protein
MHMQRGFGTAEPPMILSVAWALLLCTLIVSGAALLGRAGLNLSSSLTTGEGIDWAELLPQEHVREATLLRETTLTEDYLLQTAAGPLLVHLRYRDGAWEVTGTEQLRPGAPLPQA